MGRIVTACAGSSGWAAADLTMPGCMAGDEALWLSAAPEVVGSRGAWWRPAGERAGLRMHSSHVHLHPVRHGLQNGNLTDLTPAQRYTMNLCTHIWPPAEGNLELPHAG